MSAHPANIVAVLKEYVRDNNTKYSDWFAQAASFIEHQMSPVHETGAAGFGPVPVSDKPTYDELVEFIERMQEYIWDDNSGEAVFAAKLILERLK